uniref:ICP4 n=1 Tax=Macrostomum lignano TaxID=282301 RepID=A0A1I8GM03_9PLAT
SDDRTSADSDSGGGGGKSGVSAGGCSAPGRAPNEPPPLPDETYLLAPPEPLTEATSEAGDAPAGDETPKSPIDPQHQKSKASDGGRTERGGAGASSGAGQGAPTGGGAGGRGGAGSLRAPQQQDSKHSARDRQQPSRGSRDQDKRSTDGGPVAAAGRKSQKSVALGGSSGAAAAAAAAAAATAEADDDLREASRDGGSRDALRVASRWRRAQAPSPSWSSSPRMRRPASRTRRKRP